MNKPLDRASIEGVAPYRIPAGEFRQMARIGVFVGHRIELVDGGLIEMAPADKPHARLAAEVCTAIRQAYSRADWTIYLDVYVTLASHSVRAPDIVVTRESDDPDSDLTGDEVVLAIEISHSTLKEDLEHKRLHYAEAGIPHYWVFDVDGERVHRFARPENGDYREVATNSFDEPLPLPLIGGTISLR